MLKPLRTQAFSQGKELRCHFTYNCTIVIEKLEEM